MNCQRGAPGPASGTHREPEVLRPLHPRPPWQHGPRYGGQAGRLRSVTQALSRERPLWRRAARTARPARVRIRSRKPWVFARRRLFGWNVRLLTGAPSSLGLRHRASARGTRSASGLCPRLQAALRQPVHGKGARAPGQTGGPDPAAGTRVPAAGGHAAAPVPRPALLPAYPAGYHLEHCRLPNAYRRRVLGCGKQRPDRMGSGSPSGRHAGAMVTERNRSATCTTCGPICGQRTCRGGLCGRATRGERIGD